MDFFVDKIGKNTFQMSQRIQNSRMAEVIDIIVVAQNKYFWFRFPTNHFPSTEGNGVCDTMLMAEFLLRS